MRNGASDQLFHYGEDEKTLTFRQLISLYEQMIYQELHVAPDDDEDTKRDFPRFRQEMLSAKETALAIYDAHIQAAAQEMQDSKDEYLQGIGRALESGDWSHVAI